MNLRLDDLPHTCFLITLFANLNLLNSQIYEVGIFTLFFV